MFKEPLILVFEGASLKTLEQLKVEFAHILKDTKYEDHYFISDQIVRGIENPYIDKLDKIIELLSQIRSNQK